MRTRIAKHRLNAFKRQQGLCHYCGLPMWLDRPEEVSAAIGARPRTVSGLRCTAEHLVARQDGGANTESNIVAACLTCNGRRHRVKKPLNPIDYRKRVQGRVAAGRWHPPALTCCQHPSAEPELNSDA